MITPEFVIDAIFSLLLDHVPPEFGVMFEVSPIHIALGPVSSISEGSLTVSGVDRSEEHPVALFVNTNATLPGPIPVIVPLDEIVATVTSVLDHCPPEDGNILVSSPIHISVLPIKLILGGAFTERDEERADSQPVTLFVNLNLALPVFSAVIIPFSSIVATDSSVLIHVPPLEGVIVVDSPMHSSESDKPFIAGDSKTLIEIVPSEEHPLDNSIKVNVAMPSDSPVTTPVLLTDATLLLLLIQIPPEVGDKVVVLLIQMSAGPVSAIVGLLTMVIGTASAPVQPAFDSK